MRWQNHPSHRAGASKGAARRLGHRRWRSQGERPNSLRRAGGRGDSRGLVGEQPSARGRADAAAGGGTDRFAGQRGNWAVLSRRSAVRPCGHSSLHHGGARRKASPDSKSIAARARNRGARTCRRPDSAARRCAAVVIAPPPRPLPSEGVAAAERGSQRPASFPPLDVKGLVRQCPSGLLSGMEQRGPRPPLR